MSEKVERLWQVLGVISASLLLVWLFIPLNGDMIWHVSRGAFFGRLLLVLLGVIFGVLQFLRIDRLLMSFYSLFFFVFFVLSLLLGSSGEYMSSLGLPWTLVWCVSSGLAGYFFMASSYRYFSSGLKLLGLSWISAFLFFSLPTLSCFDSTCHWIDRPFIYLFVNSFMLSFIHGFLMVIIVLFLGIGYTMVIRDMVLKSQGALHKILISDEVVSIGLGVYIFLIGSFLVIGQGSYHEYYFDEGLSIGIMLYVGCYISSSVTCYYLMHADRYGGILAHFGFQPQMPVNPMFYASESEGNRDGTATHESVPAYQQLSVEHGDVTGSMVEVDLSHKEGDETEHTIVEGLKKGNTDTVSTKQPDWI